MLKLSAWLCSLEFTSDDDDNGDAIDDASTDADADYAAKQCCL